MQGHRAGGGALYERPLEIGPRSRCGETREGAITQPEANAATPPTSRQRDQPLTFGVSSWNFSAAARSGAAFYITHVAADRSGCAPVQLLPNPAMGSTAPAFAPRS